MSNKFDKEQEQIIKDIILTDKPSNKIQTGYSGKDTSTKKTTTDIFVQNSKKIFKNNQTGSKKIITSNGMDIPDKCQKRFSVEGCKFSKPYIKKSQTDKLNIVVHGMCEDCAVTFISNLKKQGKYETYEANKILLSELPRLRDEVQQTEELKQTLLTNPDEDFYNEYGMFDRWKLGPENQKDLIDKIGTYLSELNLYKDTIIVQYLKYIDKDTCTGIIQKYTDCLDVEQLELFKAHLQEMD